MKKAQSGRPYLSAVHQGAIAPWLGGKESFPKSARGQRLGDLNATKQNSRRREFAMGFQADREEAQMLTAEKRDWDLNVCPRQSKQLEGPSPRTSQIPKGAEDGYAP